MNSLKFKLEYQETLQKGKNYVIVHDFTAVGELYFSIKKGNLHIFNVFIHEDYQGLVGFGDWLRTFEEIFVYDVTILAMPYWQRRKANIVNLIEPEKWGDIIFEEGETDE